MHSANLIEERCPQAADRLGPGSVRVCQWEAPVGVFFSPSFSTIGFVCSSTIGRGDARRRASKSWRSASQKQLLPLDHEKAVVLQRNFQTAMKTCNPRLPSTSPSKSFLQYSSITFQLLTLLSRKSQHCSIGEHFIRRCFR